MSHLIGTVLVSGFLTEAKNVKQLRAKIDFLGPRIRQTNLLNQKVFVLLLVKLVLQYLLQFLRLHPIDFVLVTAHFRHQLVVLHLFQVLVALDLLRIEPLFQLELTEDYLTLQCLLQSV